jgi:DNA-binding NtrC family response regulator
MLAGLRPAVKRGHRRRGYAVRRAPSHSLLGPALLLYLVADAAAAQGPLDLLGALIVALAGLLSLAPLRMARAEIMGSMRVGWLGLAVACALVRRAVPDALSLVVDFADLLALVTTGVLLVDLALSVPDRFGSPQQVRTRRALLYVLALCVALLGAAAHAPVVRAFDRLWLVPAWFALLPFAFLALATTLALCIRLMRRGLSSSEEALASNAWGLLGLVPAVLVILAIALSALLRLNLGLEAERAAIAAVAPLLFWSHVRLADPSRRLSVGPTTRNAVAMVLALSASAVASEVARPFWPEGPLARAAGVLALLLFAAALHRGLRELARVALAPASGKLLLALERAQTELGAATDLLGVARAALGAARSASGSTESEPRLYLFDPALELRIDAAGQAHAMPQALHSTLLNALRERPADVLLRAPLEAQIVRKPLLRPLIEALCGLDAACMLPLIVGGELEGALLVPRGTRKSRLTLEEIEALQRFGRYLAGFLTVLSSEARASRRAESAMLESQRMTLELTRAQDELGRSSHELRALREGERLAGVHGTNVAYSPTMRALLARIDEVAAGDAPVLLIAEHGIALSPLASLLHQAVGRATRPFLVADCASVRPEHSLRALIGDRTKESLGWLDVAAGGTLLLSDLPALEKDAQRALVTAMGEGKLRIVASCRREPETLVQEGALLPELGALFGLTLRVPALRERPEDLPSLVLLALDHSARVLGRPTLGLEPDAQTRLAAYHWPGNLDELQSVVEHAVARARGPRVTLADLGSLGASHAGDSAIGLLDGTLDRVERRVLRRALERAAGNKSEAARLLGLKRTTFLDHLRRHGIDDSPRTDEAERN